MTRILAASICLLLVAPLLAQAPADRSAGPRLGQVFESQTGGIALRPPAGASEIRRAGDPDLVVEFIEEQKGWALKVHRMTFSQPMVLSTNDPTGSPPGILEATAQQFRTAQVNVEIVRQDVVNHGALEMGMLAMRYGTPQARKLAQQAIIKADDRVFYTLTFNSRSGVRPREDQAGEEAKVDPAEREAVETFQAVLDTVKVMDRAHIKLEQDERLRRTQVLLPNLNKARMTDAMMPEQWMRIIRDGRDIGYSYTVEEAHTYGGEAGVLVSSRMRTLPQADVRVDVALSMYVSFNRKREWWSTTVRMVNEDRQMEALETGTLEERTRRVRVPQAGGGIGEDDQPVMQAVQQRFLAVTRSVERHEDRYANMVPPYYLPQALGHMLPRLLPLNEARGYLFVSYISDQKELMFRYIDVGQEEEVDLLGRQVRAVPIADRIGLQGVPTIHYVSADGAYLGSRSVIETEDGESISWIVPADADTIKSRWPDAQLTKPQPAAPAAPASPQRSEEDEAEEGDETDAPQPRSRAPQPNRNRPAAPKNPAGNSR